MADGEISRAEGRRLSGGERREEILAAAGRVLADQGFLPLTFEAVAREAGVSKALIYAYFPTQGALCNGLLERALTPLAARIAGLTGDFEAVAVEAGLAYFDQIALEGSVLHLLLTDAYLDGQREAAATAPRDALWRRFIRASRP